MKEAGANVSDLRGGNNARGSGRRAFHQKPSHYLGRSERNNRRGGGGGNTRRARYVFEKLLIEMIRDGALIAILRLRQCDFSTEQMIGPEAWVNRQQLLKTPHHKRA